MKTIALATADGRSIASEVRIAKSFIARWIGLSGDRLLEEHQGLLLSPGGSIHTLSMRFSIDVVFLDREMYIVGLSPNVRPGRFRVAPRGTASVLELAAGRIAALQLQTGCRVVVARTEEAVRSNGRACAATRRTDRCDRLPIQFSLRLPLERCASVQSNLACSRGNVVRRRSP